MNVQYEQVYADTKSALSYQLLISLSLRMKDMYDEDEFFVVTNNDDYNSAVKYLEDKIGESISVIKLEDKEVKECRVAMNDLSPSCVECFDL